MYANLLGKVKTLLECSWASEQNVGGGTGGVEWMNRYTLDSYNNRAPVVQKILLSKSQDCE